jgi:hypothetical protein
MTERSTTVAHSSSLSSDSMTMRRPTELRSVQTLASRGAYVALSATRCSMLSSRARAWLAWGHCRDVIRIYGWRKAHIALVVERRAKVRVPEDTSSTSSWPMMAAASMHAPARAGH